VVFFSQGAVPAAAAAAICGVAWQLGGGSAWSPVIATALAVGGGYVRSRGAEGGNAPARIDVEL